MLVVSGTNQGFWSQGVGDETSPFLAVKVSFRVHSKKQQLKKRSYLILFSGLISADLLITRVGFTRAHGILSWAIASNRTYSVLSGIF